MAWTDLDPFIDKHSMRMQAIERYARGDIVQHIEAAMGVNRHAPHLDGRIYGAVRSLPTCA
ncbi:hypothetical protein VL15_14890 [Burkholderia cepacia]|uniref:Uncharacterized protein n=1 Tax=Burkholderia cepacia TaxID=292 RepID=A0A0J5ZU63_BURCE|nr:hypothetical protein VL15_14890 [Burkholderia cepacia]